MLLLVSAAVNFLLLGMVHRVRGQQLRNAAAVAGRQSLKIGETAPPLLARDAAGIPLTVDFTGSRTPTVLYILSPTCGWCQVNKANVNLLASNIGAKYRFVGISIREDDCGVCTA